MGALHVPVFGRLHGGAWGQNPDLHTGCSHPERGTTHCCVPRFGHGTRDCHRHHCMGGELYPPALHQGDPDPRRPGPRGLRRLHAARLVRQQVELSTTAFARGHPDRFQQRQHLAGNKRGRGGFQNPPPRFFPIYKDFSSRKPIIYKNFKTAKSGDYIYF